MAEMVLTTTSTFDQNNYEVIGLVSGMQVKSLSIARSYYASWGSVFGTGKNDWTGLTTAFAETKKEAIDIMKKQAIGLGATAIMGVRINISSNQTLYTCSCEGTAMKIRARNGGRKKTKKNKRAKTMAF
tara:strand:+ start:3047 stop:3433 length:387 start_codon:yes stop_codon:yes gene_type:complete